MKVVVTGHNGYIGTVMVDVLAKAGHEITGLDTFYYEDCKFGSDRRTVPAIRKDLRDVTPEDLRGFDAVVHLAALSNDPLGCLSDDTTLEINHRPSVRLAEARKPRACRATCSPRRAASTARPASTKMLDETGGVQSDHRLRHCRRCWWSRTWRSSPTTGSADVHAERTAYGASPRLRADIVVNNFVGIAYTTGEVLIQSDGTPWRPLVHIEDISRAVAAALDAPKELVHNQSFNVGQQRRELPDSRRRRHRQGRGAGLHDQVRGRRRPRQPLLQGELRQDLARARASRPRGRSSAAPTSCTTASSGWT